MVKVTPHFVTSTVTRDGPRRTETYVAPTDVDASRDFFFFSFFNEQRGGRGGAGGWGALPDFLFCSLFPVQQTTSGTGHGVIK